MSVIRTYDYANLGILEVHDCFSIVTGLLSLGDMGLCQEYKAGQFVFEGHTSSQGSIPTNLSGGLSGFGQITTGTTGIRQMCDLQQQLCGKAEQLKTNEDHGLMISMGEQ